MTTFIRALKGVIVKTPEAIIPILANKIKKVSNKKTNRNINSLNSIHGTNLLFNEFKQSKSNEISYFEPLIEKLNLKLNEGLTKITDYVNIIDQLSNEDKLLYLRIMYESKCFNSELMKKYVNLAIEMDSNNNHTRFWMIQDMSDMVFRFPSYLYNDYYVDRKKAILNFRRDLKLKKNVYSERNTSCKKYAIIVNGLTSETNAVSYLVYKYANELIEQGKQVAIFPNDSLLYYQHDCVVRPIKSAISCSAIMFYKHKKMLNKQIEIFYTHGMNIKERIRNCLNNIKRYSPDVVIDAAGQGSFFTVFLKGIYPILHLTFNGYMVGSFFDKYISKCKKITLELNKTYHAISPDKIEEILIGFEYKYPKKKFRRENYGLLSEDFVYITVGNRLDVELKKDFISIVCNHIMNSYYAKWIIVGTVDNKMFLDYQELIERKKIILIPYEKDLTGLYKLCNAYIEPDRMGGGTSVFWAMFQGLPIIISDFYSDILPTVGMENSVRDGYLNFSKFMKKLEDDKEFYKLNSDLMKERAYESNIRQYISSLIKIADNVALKRSKHDFNN